MIRVAKFGDIPRIVELMEEAASAWQYADVCSVDVVEAKRVLLNAIKSHGGTREGSTFVAVSDKDGMVEGYIVGVLQRFYSVTDALEATDWQWLCSKRAPARDPIKLVLAMHKWAKSAPKCIAVFQANTDLWVNHKSVTRALEGIGMKRCGDVLRKDFHHE